MVSKFTFRYFFIIFAYSLIVYDKYKGFEKTKD